MSKKRADNGIPKYQQIATDIAYKIVNGIYQEGQKIYARSAIGSQYSVSSETARRAMCILADWDVVTIEKNSGLLIMNRWTYCVSNLLQQHEKTRSIHNLKRNILDSVKRQQQEIEVLYDYLTEMIDQIERYRSTNPFIPYEMVVTEETPYLDRTVGEVDFWQETFATVIAIRRNGVLMMSPGPKAVFRKNDIIYYTGDEDCPDRVRKFMYPD